MPQLATFNIGSEMFGVDILLTKEIGKIHEITKVPGAPEYFLGLMNLRGQIVTVMNPGLFLDQNSSDQHKERRLIILKTENELESLRKNDLVRVGSLSKDPLAIVIDEIGDVLDVDQAQIIPPPPNLSGVKKEFVSGVVQLKQQLIILLALDRLVHLSMQEKVEIDGSFSTAELLV